MSFVSIQDFTGSKNCLPVIYEQLVLHPEQWMRKILRYNPTISWKKENAYSNNYSNTGLDFSFLELPWDDSVMHHEQQINKKGGISLSKVLIDNLFAYLLAVLISHRKWQYIIPYKSGIFITLFRWSVPQIRLSNQLIWTRFQSKLPGLYYIILTFCSLMGNHLSKQYLLGFTLCARFADTL